MEKIFQSGFAEHLHEALKASRNDWWYQYQEQSEEYKEVGEELDAVYKRIEEGLGKDYKLINQYDALKNDSLSIGDEYVYIQGFHDCVTLLKILRVL